MVHDMVQDGEHSGALYALLRAGRDFHFEFQDTDTSLWVRLDDGTEMEDLGEIPRITVKFTKSKAKFYHARFVHVSRQTIKQLRGEMKLSLRIPQKGALEKLFKKTSQDHNCLAFFICLPTGCGKTLVMALAPYMIDANRVLVITPSKTIHEQTYGELTKMYCEGHDVYHTAEDGPKIVQVMESANQHADIVVANISDLITKGPKGSSIKVHAKFDDLLSVWQPDVVLVDEGHHCPANSWEAVINAVRTANNKCKLIPLTATPKRGDGRCYGLPDQDALYLFPRAEAVKLSLIKETVPVAVTIDDALMPVTQNTYDNPEYQKSIVSVAVSKLLELRKLLHGAPLRMLVTARTKKCSEKLASLINSMDENGVDGAWKAKLVAASIYADAKDQDKNAETKKLFKSSGSRKEKIIDIVVHCGMLGEGYDNPWIAVSAFVAPAKQVNALAQIHGRALRKNQELADAYRDGEQSSRAMTSYLVYPNVPDVHGIVTDYLESKDESIEDLFYDLQYKTFKAANRKIGKLTTVAAAAELSNNFDEYHDKYEERRKTWDPLPAESVAEIIFNSNLSSTGIRHTKSFTVADFGCGRDGLFENRLADLVADRTVNGKVTVYAVDVKPMMDADALTKRGGQGAHDGMEVAFTEFACKPVVCDYSKAHERQSGIDESCDAAVFCLSLMGSDSLPVGLIVAAQVVKPGGDIFVVNNLWWFGIDVRRNKADKEQAAKSWCDNFMKACLNAKVAFKIKEWWIKKDMCYLQITNVGADELHDIDKKLDHHFEAKSLRESRVETVDDPTDAEAARPPKRQRDFDNANEAHNEDAD